LKTTVGDFENGLVYDVSTLYGMLTNNEDGVTKRLEAVELSIGTSDFGLVREINELKSAIGDSDSGLAHDVEEAMTSAGSAMTTVTTYIDKQDDDLNNELMGNYPTYNREIIQFSDNLKPYVHVHNDTSYTTYSGSITNLYIEKYQTDETSCLALLSTISNEISLTRIRFGPGLALLNLKDVPDGATNSFFPITQPTNQHIVVDVYDTFFAGVESEKYVETITGNLISNLTDDTSLTLIVRHSPGSTYVNELKTQLSDWVSGNANKEVHFVLTI
jgi:hypothetical protein